MLKYYALLYPSSTMSSQPTPTPVAPVAPVAPLAAPAAAPTPRYYTIADAYGDDDDEVAALDTAFEEERTRTTQASPEDTVDRELESYLLSKAEPRNVDILKYWGVSMYTIYHCGMLNIE